MSDPSEFNLVYLWESKEFFFPLLFVMITHSLASIIKNILLSIWVDWCLWANYKCGSVYCFSIWLQFYLFYNCKQVQSYPDYCSFIEKLKSNSICPRALLFFFHLFGQLSYLHFPSYIRFSLSIPIKNPAVIIIEIASNL